MSKFLQDNDDAKAIATHFSQNSQAKKETADFPFPTFSSFSKIDFVICAKNDLLLNALDLDQSCWKRRNCT